MTKFTAVVFAFIVATGAVMAQDAKPEYGTKVSGVLFSRWEWNQAGAGASEKDANQFAIERMYLNFRGPLAEDINFRATLDIYSVSANDVKVSTTTTTTTTADSVNNLKSTSNSTSTSSISNLNAMMQLKYAYFEWKAASWLNFRGGMQMTEWIDYVEGLWGYRGISKVLLDDRGISASSDLGLSGIAKLPNKLGEVQISVLNGTGFRLAENNRFKDLAGRVVITPLMDGGGDFKKLQVAAHYYTGNTALGVSRSRFGALVALPTDNFNVGFEFGSFSNGVKADSSTKSSGFSAWLELKGRLASDDLSRLSLLARMDSYDPNSDLTDATRTISANAKLSKLILGLVYQLAKPVTVSLDYQSLSYKGNGDLLTKYDGTKTSADSRIYLHFIVNL